MMRDEQNRTEASNYFWLSVCYKTTDVNVNTGISPQCYHIPSQYHQCLLCQPARTSALYMYHQLVQVQPLCNKTEPNPLKYPLLSSSLHT